MGEGGPFSKLMEKKVAFFVSRVIGDTAVTKSHSEGKGSLHRIGKNRGALQRLDEKEKKKGGPAR